MKSDTIWKLDKAVRMRILKQMIVPSKFKPLYPIKKKWSIQKWKSDLGKICDLYGCGLNIEDTHNGIFDGRFCWSEKDKTIIYLSNHKRKTTDNEIVDFCHEISHAIQFRLYGKSVLININKTFSSALTFELEACQLGYYVYKTYFSHLELGLKFSQFMIYRNKWAQENLLK